MKLDEIYKCFGEWLKEKPHRKEDNMMKFMKIILILGLLLMANSAYAQHKINITRAQMMVGCLENYLLSLGNIKVAKSQFLGGAAAHTSPSNVSVSMDDIISLCEHLVPKTGTYGIIRGVLGCYSYPEAFFCFEKDNATNAYYVK